jgi:DNA-binding IclR family transcriptional regulator
VQVLRCLAQRSEPVGVNQLASEAGIVPSTCLHILRALTREGLVAVDPTTKRYRLGIGVISLARAFLNRRNIVLTVQPLLDRLARERGVTAVLVERADAMNLVVAAVAEGADMFSVKVTVGTTFPSLSSATGRCEAAFAGFGEAALRERFGRLRWQNAPGFTDWLDDVRRVPACGYAMDRGNYIRGLTVISAPVHVHGTTLERCIAAVALKEQLSPGRQNALIEALLAAARELGDVAF